MAANAIPASPLPACVKNSRRLETFQWCLSLLRIGSAMASSLIDVQELVRIEQHLRQVDQCGGPRWIDACGRVRRHRRLRLCVTSKALGHDWDLVCQKIRRDFLFLSGWRTSVS